MTCIAVNTFAGLTVKINNKSLSDVPPVTVLNCLEKSLECPLFSELAYDTIRNIIANIELTGPESA
jgi:hypothetical protein